MTFCISVCGYFVQTFLLHFASLFVDMCSVTLWHYVTLWRCVLWNFASLFADMCSASIYVHPSSLCRPLIILIAGLGGLLPITGRACYIEFHLFFVFFFLLSFFFSLFQLLGSPENCTKFYLFFLSSFFFYHCLVLAIAGCAYNFKFHLFLTSSFSTSF